MDRLLSRQPQIDDSKLTAVGFSLGAHATAFMTNELEKRRGLRFPRIIGLDPAGPLFQCEPIVTRLDPSDAVFVQVD